MPVSQPLLVAGTAAGAGGLEPSAIDSVTVAIDGSAPVPATTEIVLGQKPPTVKFNATVPFPDTVGLHEVVVRAVDDQGKDGSARVAVVGHGGPAKGRTPRESLEVTATNAGPPSAGDWATQIVKSNRSAPAVLASLLSLAVWQQRGDDYPVCEYEWNNVTNPSEDYDEVPVAFSGWLLQPELSGNDVPFTHPFGMDWECMVALDSEYAGLLAEGNTVPDGTDGADAIADALGLDIPVPSGGLLALETDSACVPSALRELGSTGPVRVGDRIAALGRWIVDAGHSIDVNGGKSYRAEMHPPMMMAIAGTRTDASGEDLTRLVLTSRPYLVRQVYTTDTGTIYDDNASDDGPLLAHLNNEIDKLHGVIPSSWTLEAHPKIASKPFNGVHFLRLTVRPPGSQGPVPGPAGAIQVSFQFTCRSGVGVQVVSAEGGVDVLLVLNSVDYAAPPLPPRQTVSYNKDQLGVASDLITFEQIVSIFSVSPISIADAEQALARGIETDSYQVGDVDLLDRSHMLPFVPIDNIPGGQGIMVDDGQPYPVFGFLEIRQLPPAPTPGAAGPAAEA